jgi:phage-related protein
VTSTIPIQQINDAHKLTADAEIDLFDLVPSIGTGTIHFKSDGDVTWQGTLYTGVPLQFDGENYSASAGTPQPRLVIGQENSNLSAFKPLIFDGTIDGAVITRSHILLDDLVNNRLIRSVHYYRVRRVEAYSRYQITLQLASQSDSLTFSMPFRSYLPPAFPSVTP